MHEAIKNRMNIKNFAYIICIILLFIFSLNVHEAQVKLEDKAGLVFSQFPAAKDLVDLAVMAGFSMPTILFIFFIIGLFETGEKKSSNSETYPAIENNAGSIMLIAKSRLENEKNEYIRSANINLSIATISGFFTFAILVYAITAIGDEKSLNSILISFLPKIVLAISSQVFSFFFLSMYKSGFNEIKYYQNEITNLELKHAALIQAEKLDDKDTQIKLIEKFSLTERNFKLEDGQSTVQLEDRKIDIEENKEVTNILSSLINKLIPENSNNIEK